MAQNGFCEARLTDMHKKVEEKRAPLRTWANACKPKVRWMPAESEEPRAVAPKAGPSRRWAHRQPASSEDGIIMGYAESNVNAQPDEREEEALLLHLNGLQSLSGFCMLMPNLLNKEMETAMEELGLIYDRTYAWDVFSDMMKNQARFAFPSAELPRPFTGMTHAILVDWLIQVHEIFHFSEETLYLAIHLLNRALRQMKVSISNLQLLGVVCLFLAGKKEECLLPEVSELCYLMENTYSKRQLLRMERRVLRELNFELSHCPPLHFLVLFATIGRCSDKVTWMARYLLELSLLENQCVVFEPAQLATAALCLARQVLQEASTPDSEMAWCLSASLHVGSEPMFHRIMQILAVAAAKASNPETRASFIKFSTAETLHVSSHPGLTAAPYPQSRAQMREGAL